ncbi:type II toxin-antitoxin system PemK/MazF family toxin [Streptomyces sp. NPDC002055]|uniref:type II toxin-antitoxin system PemK/MazF family toxin n=1 Tax=Streptomyces sp. NPDC002055 TaxID=3154534 RepID=UPI00331F798D
MDTSWWPVVGAVVVLALIAALVDGLGRSGRGGHRPRPRPSSRRPSRRPPRSSSRPSSGTATRPPSGTPGRPPKRVVPGGGPRPRPGEIWWADVPYEDGPGSKDRPCLVLDVRGHTVLVAKITSRFHDGRPGVIPLPEGTVGDARGRQSFLETDELREVRLDEFRRCAGKLDRSVWTRVRHLSG